MESKSNGESKVLQLEPFSHQVGGQTSILLLDKNTVCKPLIANELNFYETAPDCLKVFLPQLKGVVDVSCDANVDGFLNFTASLPSKTSPRGKLNGEGETNIKQEIRGEYSEDENQCRREAELMLENLKLGGQGYLSADLNPGALRWQKRQLQKLQASSNGFSQKFIMLENLTSKYELPCVLDIKMGTRCHGDNISSSKYERLHTKAMNTTSATLGLRICGIQVYDQESKQYIYHNKYYGRGLTAETFHEALQLFFKNGTGLRRDTILELTKKLRRLQRVIRSLDTFRFYASSLLVVYGSVNASVQDVQCSERNNLQNGNATENGLDCCSIDATSYEAESSLDEESQNSSDIVTVKMIDFGHTVHEHMVADHDIHTGPHRGYLFGLDNLILQLKLIQDIDSRKQDA